MWFIQYITKSRLIDAKCLCFTPPRGMWSCNYPMFCSFLLHYSLFIYFTFCHTHKGGSIVSLSHTQRLLILQSLETCRSNGALKFWCMFATRLDCESESEKEWSQRQGNSNDLFTFFLRACSFLQCVILSLPFTN